MVANESEKTYLYQTNFTANVLVFNKQGKQVLATQYNVPKASFKSEDSGAVYDYTVTYTSKYSHRRIQS